MGQTVYVLMQLEGRKGKEDWRPVAVVTNPDVAAEWETQGGKNVDWVPLEVDDVNYLSPGKEESGRHSVPTFRPRQRTQNEQAAEELAAKLQEQNKRLVDIVKRLEKRLGIKEQTPKQPVASLLKKKE